MNEILLAILQTLVIIFFVFLPYIILIPIMAIEIGDMPWKILKSFLLLFLPWIIILVGIISGVDNFNINILDLPAIWYYLIPATWFTSGVVFFSALD